MIEILLCCFMKNQISCWNDLYFIPKSHAIKSCNKKSYQGIYQAILLYKIVYALQISIFGILYEIWILNDKSFLKRQGNKATGRIQLVESSVLLSTSSFPNMHETQVAFEEEIPTTANLKKESHDSCHIRQ